MTGSTRLGSMPAAAVYTASLPTAMLDAADAPVADPQDRPGVGGHDQVDLVAGLRPGARSEVSISSGWSTDR